MCWVKQADTLKFLPTELILLRMVYINYTSTAKVGKYLFITNPMGISITGDCVIGDHLEIHRGATLGRKMGSTQELETMSI